MSPLGSLFGGPSKKPDAAAAPKEEPIRAASEKDAGKKSLFGSKSGTGGNSGSRARGGLGSWVRNPLILVAVVSVGWYYLGVLPAQRGAAADAQATIAAKQKEIDALKNAEADRTKAQAEQKAAETAKPSLRVASTPAGAEIFFNGAPAPGNAKTPATITELPAAGPLQIALRLAGYKEYSVEVQLAGAPLDLGTIALKPLTGGLALSANRSGATFTLTGPAGLHKTGALPAQLDDLPVGKYTVTFEHNRWQLPAQEFDLTSSEPQAKVATFPYSSLRLTSVPAGATVWEGRQKLGVTPLEWKDLRAFTRTFSLLLPGYAFARVTVSSAENSADPAALDVVKEVALEKSRDFETSSGMPMVWVSSGTGGGFWAGRYEVRQADWDVIFPGGNSSTFRGARRPVETVSWLQAEDFCKRLTQKERAAGRLPEGYVYALPTEAQWDELSADASPTNSVMSYHQTLLETAEAGTSEPNALGIFDAVGNVWEWCRDEYDAAGKNNRSMRGGCWLSSKQNFPSKGTRSGASATYRDRFIGLRVVCVPGS